MAKREQSVHGYIARAQREGISQAQTMRDLRSVGFRFTDRTFRSQWGEIQRARAIRGNVADANINARPRTDIRSPISGGKRGDYLYRFDVLLKRPGETELLQTHVGVRTSKLVTFNDAAAQFLASFLDNEDRYGSSIVDWIPAAVNEFEG